MTVSVLVPVYGVEKYIARCAQSLFEQTYKDIEYIFVNDCTPDRSIALLREVAAHYPHRQPQIHIVCNERNMGLGATRARAVSLATGFALMHVDSDDCLPTDAVELLARQMQATGADMVDGAYQEVGKKGLSATTPPTPIGNPRKYLRRVLCQNIVANHVWARLYKRTLYTGHGINMLPGIDYGEDYSVIPRLLFFAQRTTIDCTVYYYNTANLSSYTNNMSEKHAVSYLKANQVVYDFFTTHDTQATYRTALHIGMLNAVRTIRRNQLPMQLVNTWLQYQPKGWICRLIWQAFMRPWPYKVANGLYLLYRKLYLLTH